MARIIFIVFLMTSINTYSQKSQIVYKLKIITKTGRIKAGYLRDLNDSTITISPKPLLNSTPESISTKSISKIYIRDRKGPWKGTIIGAIGGALIGGIIGYSTYENPHCSSSSFCIDFGPGVQTAGGAIIGGLSGALVGLAVGSSSKKIELNNNGSSIDFPTEKIKQYILTPER